MLYTAVILYAWGSKGHTAIGDLTMSFLSEEMQVKVQDLLSHDDKKYSLGEASVWADTVKRTKEFSWTSTLHYMDVADSPPTACALFSIPAGPNVVNAAVDFYEHLESPTNVTAVQGLKFFIHLFQDLHQPLHVEGKAKGGNGIKVSFNKRQTNLHSVWDSDMINKRIKDNFNNEYPAWLASLKSKSVKQLCFNTCQAISCDANVSSCLASWAQYVNKLNCDTVWGFQGNELTEAYYQKNIVLIEDLLVVAAMRSAQLLTLKLR